MIPGTYRAAVMLVVLAAFAAAAQSQTPAAPAAPPTETVAPAIPGVVAAGTPVRLLKTGLKGTEGPIALEDGSLLFTEREANRVTRIDPHGVFSTYLESPNGTNSLAIDSKGRLLAVQWIVPRVAILAPGGMETAIADAYQGQKFGRPNDLTVDRLGGVYISDPGAVAPAKPAVFYVKPGGEVVKVTDEVERPNGVLLSPDEKTLYVADTAGEYVIAFDRAADGSTSRMHRFARLQGPARTDGTPGVRGGADGLAIDAAGRLYVATTVGVQVFSATGDPLGTIPIGVPNGPQNLAFAGPDKKTLYVVGRGAAFAVAMQAQGFTGRAK